MNNNNGRGIFYGVIGVATLVVAIIGATFAYFTATASTSENITGNMASISLRLDVGQVTDVDDAPGLIPMSNGMVEAAVNAQGTNEQNVPANQKVCVDDNGNAVCQIYKVTLHNDSSAAVFVDGYVALRNATAGNAGAPTDYTNYTRAADPTTMRWAQVFADGSAYTTKLIAATGYNLGGETALTWDSLDAPNNAQNTAAILTSYASAVDGGKVTIYGNSYDAIRTNYIRVSDHAWAATGDEGFDRNNDITSALVYNQRIAPTSFVDYYFVVWLTETGKNQNFDPAADENTATVDFFNGTVSFVSASGSEVSATFSGLTAYHATT